MLDKPEIVIMLVALGIAIFFSVSSKAAGSGVSSGKSKTSSTPTDKKKE